MHGPVRAPETAGVGSASLSVSLVGWKDGNVAPAKLSATVVVSKFMVKTEPVSPRLLRSLPHPDREAIITKVLFNREGQLIVAGYPSGIVQVLDPSTGKEFRTIETPRGKRSSFNYIQFSNDLRTLFVNLESMKAESAQMGEKKSWFRRYEGETRWYDLGTGAQKEPLRVEPRRGVVTMAISPDACRIVTNEFTSGRAEDFAKLNATYLWDLKTRQAVKLRDGYGDMWFSPDSKTVFITVNDQKKKTGVMYEYSATTGKEVGKRESADGPWPGFLFSRDGAGVAASGIDSQTKKPIVRLYDPLSFEPKAMLEVADDDEGLGRFGQLKFSPDGSRLAAVKNSTVFLWDVKSRKLLRSWRLDNPGRILFLAFDAEGRRLAASTIYVPPEMEKNLSKAANPEDFPQPKVVLIDVSSNKIETIVCPHGEGVGLAFSPNGNFLAVGGFGATHVFNVGKQ